MPLNRTTGTNYLGYSETGKDINTETYYEWAFDYTKKIEDHQITALVVGTRRNRLLANQGTLQKSLPYRNQGVSRRLTYGFDNRYIAEFNFGYNGSERFHSSQRYGFFPSIGAAYNISREKFWDPIRPVVNDLKIRATYGYTGNDAIGTADDRFFYLSTVNMSDAQRGAFFGTYYKYWLPGITINRYSNEEITWETSRKTNIGLDAKLFNSLNLVVEFFKEYRDNILMDRAYIPATLGLSAPVRANLGKAEAKGFDISMDYSKNFGQQAWAKFQGNFTYSTGKFLFYEEPEYPQNEYYLKHAGQSINQRWGLIAERLFIDENDVKNSPKQNFGEYMAGDIKYYDTNGDGEITDLDRVPIGFPTVPEIIYGGGISAGYKNFDLSFFLQGSARSSFWIDPAQTAPFVRNPTLGAGSQNALLKVYADDYWSEDNRNNYALWPRLSHTLNKNNTQLSTWFMRNGAFLRLKSVELGYTLPKNLIKGMNLNSRIYVNGLNLLTFSQFKYWDIEMGGNGLGYPIQKVINLGLTVNF